MVLTQAATRKAVRSALVLGLALCAGTTAGKDPDLRKLQERVPPAFGEIWRLGDPTPRSGPTESVGVTLLSHVPLNQFPGVARSMGNDCWGYVSPSGREYAILGLEGGYGFVEITNPTDPQVIATIPGPSSMWHDVKVVGAYAYGVSEGGSGIQVMDMTNIDNGQVTLVRNWTSGGYSTTHNIIAGDDDDSLWICGANIGNGGLIHIDITNPTLPAFGGGWTQMYVHDAQVVVWDRGDLAGRRLAFCAGGFNVGLSETGLRIVDVTNPNNPQVLSTVFYPGARYAHQVWLSEDRRFLYLNDELDVGETTNETTTRVFNVEDPANAFFVGTFSTGLPSVAHNLYTHNGMIFQSNYRSGLRVFDALDPQNPVEIGHLTTFQGTISPEFNGAWSNYPYFPSGNVIVSDIERGLFVARVDAEPRAVAVRAVGETPAVIPPAGGTTIDAAVFVRDPSNPVVAVDLMIDTGSGFQPVPAAQNPDGSWTATTPPAPCDSTARAYLRAEVADGRSAVYPPGAPGESIELTVADGVSEVFADDFTTDQGWTVGAPGDDATSGIWVRADPVGTSTNGVQVQPQGALFGNAAYITGQHPGGGVGTNDIDNGRTTLTTPRLDLSAGETTTTISYWRWYSNTAGAAPAADVFTVDISNDDGLTWVNVETVGPDGPQVSGGWFEHRFNPADLVPVTDRVRMRFVAADEGAGSLVEAAVDGFRIDTLDCDGSGPGCAVADIAEPFGVLNFFDLAAFLDLYNGADPFADFNDDGFINFFDISAYLSSYNQGCP